MEGLNIIDQVDRWNMQLAALLKVTYVTDEEWFGILCYYGQKKTVTSI